MSVLYLSEEPLLCEYSRVEFLEPAILLFHCGGCEMVHPTRCAQDEPCVEGRKRGVEERTWLV